MRCKHPFKKIELQPCWPILRSNSAIRPSDQRCSPLPGNTLPGPCRNSRRQRCSTLAFTSNARATLLQPPHSGQFELLGENPSRQPHDSILLEWILSLNWLCQEWGQVQHHARLFQLHELGAAILSPVRATVKDQKQPIRAGQIAQRPDRAGLVGQCKLRNSFARIWAGCIAIVCSPDVTRSHLGWNWQPCGSQPSKFSHGCGLFGEILGRMIHSTMVASCDVVVLVTSAARVS